MLLFGVLSNNQLISRIGSSLAVGENSKQQQSFYTATEF